MHLVTDHDDAHLMFPLQPRPGITAARLNSLSKPELLKICTNVGLELSQKTLKEDIVAALLNTGLSLEDLTSVQLSYLCYAEDLAKGGRKEEKIERLLAASKETKNAAKLKSNGHKQKQQSAPGQVSKKGVRHSMWSMDCIGDCQSVWQLTWRLLSQVVLALQAAQ